MSLIFPYGSSSEVTPLSLGRYNFFFLEVHKATSFLSRFGIVKLVIMVSVKLR